MAGMVMLALLRKWGISIESDVTLVDSGINDRSYEVLLEKKIDAALLPPEKAFLAEAMGFRMIADSLDLDCHWVPLATTRRFLNDHREVVRKIVTIYAESVRLFKSQPQETIKEISRWLPALAQHPQVVEKCYALFAREFESSIAAVDEFAQLRLARSRISGCACRRDSTGGIGRKPALAKRGNRNGS